jgi:hypothetical protein
MNDPEVTMLDTLPSNGLIAHSTALEAAGLTLALAPSDRVKRQSRRLLARTLKDPRVGGLCASAFFWEGVRIVGSAVLGGPAPSPHYS